MPLAPFSLSFSLPSSPPAPRSRALPPARSRELPVTAVSAGGRHDLALLSDGTVLSWGDDTYGQLGNGDSSANGDAEQPTLVANLAGVVAVAAGGERSLALESNGTVKAWGDNDDGHR